MWHCPPCGEKHPHLLRGYAVRTDGGSSSNGTRRREVGAYHSANASALWFRALAVHADFEPAQGAQPTAQRRERSSACGTVEGRRGTAHRNVKKEVPQTSHIVRDAPAAARSIAVGGWQPRSSSAWRSSSSSSGCPACCRICSAACGSTTRMLDIGARQPRGRGRSGILPVLTSRRCSKRHSINSSELLASWQTRQRVRCVSDVQDPDCSTAG